MKISKKSLWARSWHISEPINQRRRLFSSSRRSHQSARNQEKARADPQVPCSALLVIKRMKDRIIPGNLFYQVQVQLLPLLMIHLIPPIQLKIKTCYLSSKNYILLFMWWCWSCFPRSPTVLSPSSSATHMKMGGLTWEKIRRSHVGKVATFCSSFLSVSLSL